MNVERRAERGWDRCLEEFGDHLRVVACYDGPRFETRMREDVREHYTDADDQRIVDETVVQQLSSPNIEDAVSVGRLRAAVNVFDDAYVVRVPTPPRPKAGYIVSLDREAGVESDLAERVLAAVAEE